VSFSYDDGDNVEQKTQKDHLKYLSKASKEELEESVVGIDRGVKIAIQAGDQVYNPPKIHTIRRASLTKDIKRLQKRLSRQKKGSNRRQKTKQRIKKKHESIANMRKDFAHKTSHELVTSKAQVLVFEDLKIKQMTKKAKPKKDENGKYIKNNKKAKSGLNLAILDKTLAMIYTFCFYKAQKYIKAVFKISASFTSQECADCGHIHPENRRTQSEFVCISCAHTDNADRNAAKVIKKRAINLILDSGTELSKKGLLTPSRQGTLSQHKTRKANALRAIGDDVSKMINQVPLVT
jgi:putative transposase